MKRHTAYVCYAGTPDRVLDKKLVALAKKYTGKEGGSGCFLGHPQERDISFSFRDESKRNTFMRSVSKWKSIKFVEAGE